MKSVARVLRRAAVIDYGTKVNEGGDAVNDGGDVVNDDGDTINHGRDEVNDYGEGAHNDGKDHDEVELTPMDFYVLGNGEPSQPGNGQDNVVVNEVHVQ
ncbi:unnamed protein product [Lactuca saligna]|uniref:Uncharacterized protein n=1 Tax=Lactuca saligna TaxID=75948 RepID=A0AA35ZUB4_LACSI|nr:unnamed protein product [Lactuca saligna]